MEKFRPYALPDKAWLEEVKEAMAQKTVICRLSPLVEVFAGVRVR